MEELRAAISAMKHAEEALAKQGINLRWKIKFKPHRRRKRGLCDCLRADANVREKTPAPRGTPGKPVPEKEAEAEPEAAAEQTAPEAAHDKEQEEDSAADEVRPITALDLKEAAEYLMMSTSRVCQLMKHGKLLFHGERGKRWFMVEELNLYLASKKKSLAT